MVSCGCKDFISNKNLWERETKHTEKTKRSQRKIKRSSFLQAGSNLIF
jgi:hypothetical protein